MQEGKVEKELMMNLDIPCGVSICHYYDDHNSDAPVTVRNNISLYPCYLLSSKHLPHYFSAMHTATRTINLQYHGALYGWSPYASNCIECTSVFKIVFGSSFQYKLTSEQVS